MNGKTSKNWKWLESVCPYSWQASAAPLRFFLSHRQTLGATKLKLSDFVGTFIVHILAKNILGNASSGHQNRSRDQTSRVLLLKFEVVLKPNCFSDQFQTYRVLLVYLKLVYPELCMSAT